MFSMPVVEPNCEPYIWHRVPEWLISFWVAGWLFWPASIKERVAIYTWINTYSWYELSFLQYLYFLKCVCVRGGRGSEGEREMCVSMLMEARRREGLCGISGDCELPSVLGPKLRSLGEEQQVLSSSFPVLDINFNSHPLYYEKTTCGLRKVILTIKISLIISLLNM